MPIALSNDNEKCLQTLSNVPWVVKSPPVENHCSTDRFASWPKEILRSRCHLLWGASSSSETGTWDKTAGHCLLAKMLFLHLLAAGFKSSISFLFITALKQSPSSSASQINITLFLLKLFQWESIGPYQLKWPCALLGNKSMLEMSVTSSSSLS